MIILNFAYLLDVANSQVIYPQPVPIDPSLAPAKKPLTNWYRGIFDVFIKMPALAHAILPLENVMPTVVVTLIAMERSLGFPAAPALHQQQK
jgi:hypothetical protein